MGDPPIRREPAWASRRLFLTWALLLPALSILNVVIEATDGSHGRWDFWRLGLALLWCVALAALVGDFLLRRRLKRRGLWPEAATGPARRPPVDYSVPLPPDGSLVPGRADQAPLQEWLKRRRRR